MASLVDLEVRGWICFNLLQMSHHFELPVYLTSYKPLAQIYSGLKYAPGLQRSVGQGKSYVSLVPGRVLVLQSGCRLGGPMDFEFVLPHELNGNNTLYKFKKIPVIGQMILLAFLLSPSSYPRRNSAAPESRE
jgi:hypothetical protein